MARPVGDFSNSADYQYQTLRCNVDLLKLIQLGISFTDASGNLKQPGVCTWQFNMKFDLELDMYAQDSIDLLQRSGIDFDKHRDFGIDVENFAELLISSGLVLNPKVKWIAFHGGYDFAYLLRCMIGANLPADEAEFFNLLSIWFPSIYDIKHLMQGLRRRRRRTKGFIFHVVFAQRETTILLVVLTTWLRCCKWFVLVRNIRLEGERCEKTRNDSEVCEFLVLMFGFDFWCLVLLLLLFLFALFCSDSLLTALTFFELVRKHLPGLLEEADNECKGRIFGLNWTQPAAIAAAAAPKSPSKTLRKASTCKDQKTFSLVHSETQKEEGNKRRKPFFFFFLGCVKSREPYSV